MLWVCGMVLARIIIIDFLIEEISNAIFSELSKGFIAAHQCSRSVFVCMCMCLSCVCVCISVCVCDVCGFCRWFCFL